MISYLGCCIEKMFHLYKLQTLSCPMKLNGNCDGITTLWRYQWTDKILILFYINYLYMYMPKCPYFIHQ